MDRTDQLAAWCRSWLDPGCRVVDVRRLSGHGGETLAVTLALAGTAGRRLVVRLAPGSARRGNADVLRQVPLLKRLTVSPVPVAPLVAWTDDPAWFGADALAQEHVDGAPLHLFEAGLSVAAGADPEPFVRSALGALAAVHRESLEGWDDPRGPADEVRDWACWNHRIPEPGWAEAAQRLAGALLATAPTAYRPGLVHGDFQPGNVLFTPTGEVRAVVDWELAGLGATALDVAWLAMLLDRSSWAEPQHSQLLVTARPDQVRAWYAEAGGEPVAHWEWFLALAHYRYGVISALNVRLHRTGRRPDPFNASMAASVPVLLERGLTTLG